MDTKTFNKVTKKRPFRELKLWWKDTKLFFKLKALKVLCLLHIIDEYRDYSSGYLREDSPKADRDIVVGRGVFLTSYVARIHFSNNKHWYQTKKGKTLHIFSNSVDRVWEIDWRAELKQFEIRLNPVQRCIVRRDHQEVVFHSLSPLKSVMSFTDATDRITITSKTLRCDFFKARYGARFTSTLDMDFAFALSLSIERLRESLVGKDTEINELLTGIKDDGNLISPEGYVLDSQRICRCGRPVFRADSLYFCYRHGLAQYSDVLNLAERKEEYLEQLERFMPELLEYCNRKF